MKFGIVGVPVGLIDMQNFKCVGLIVFELWGGGRK